MPRKNVIQRAKAVNTSLSCRVAGLEKSFRLTALLITLNVLRRGSVRYQPGHL